MEMVLCPKGVPHDKPYNAAVSTTFADKGRGEKEEKATENGRKQECKTKSELLSAEILS